LNLSKFIYVIFINLDIFALSMTLGLSKYCNISLEIVISVKSAHLQSIVTITRKLFEIVSKIDVSIYELRY